VVVTITRDGYVKRTPAGVYKSQRRGGRGITAVDPKLADVVQDIFITRTHHYLLFFTAAGKVYRLKVYELPEASRQARGTALVNLLSLAGNDRVTAIVPVRDPHGDACLFMVTRRGIVKRTRLEEFANVRRDGIIALNLDPEDELVAVRLTRGNDEILLVTAGGLAIRFPEAEVRVMGRMARGVRGINLRAGDRVVGADVVKPGADLLVVTANGYGKRTPLDAFRVQSRGGKGIIAARVTDKNGPVVAQAVVERGEEVVMVSAAGILIRLKVKEIPVHGRATRGVLLMRLDAGDRLVALAHAAPEA